jgi:hypothetical protein
VLTRTGNSASKRSLIVIFPVSGQVPCSGAKRRDKVLDEVSTAIFSNRWPHVEHKVKIFGSKGNCS